MQKRKRTNKCRYLKYTLRSICVLYVTRKKKLTLHNIRYNITAFQLAAYISGRQSVKKRKICTSYISITYMYYVS